MTSAALWIFIPLVLAAGIGVACQAAVNSVMRTTLANPVGAALVNFGVGAVALLLYKFATGAPWPDPAKLATAPWWAFTGGFFGAFMVVIGIVAVPRIGAAMFFALLIAGQMVASSVIDHYGLFGIPMKPFSLVRLAAVLLVLGGASLLRLK